MLNEGFLQIARMVLGIFIITSLKAICPTCLSGYTGPPFIAFNVLSSQPLNKMLWLHSNNAAVVWSSYTLVGNMHDRSAKCLVQVSLACARLALACWGQLQAASIIQGAATLWRGSFSGCCLDRWWAVYRAESVGAKPGLRCQISCEVGVCRWNRDMNYSLLMLIKTFGAYSPAEMKNFRANRNP